MMKRPSSTLSNPIAIPQPRSVASIQDNTSDYGSIDSVEASILSTLSPAPESQSQLRSQPQTQLYAAQSRSQPTSKLDLEDLENLNNAPKSLNSSDIESDYGDLDEPSALQCLSQAESQPLNPRTLVLEPLADPIFEHHAGSRHQDAGVGNGPRSASLRLPVIGFERDVDYYAGSSLYTVDEQGNKIGRDGIERHRMARQRTEAAVEVEYDFRNRIQFSRKFCSLPSHGCSGRISIRREVRMVAQIVHKKLTS